MAADTGMDTCPSPEITDSRKRPLDGDSENGDVKRSHFSSVQDLVTALPLANGHGNITSHFAVEPTYHFKVLVPSMVAGAIIGKGGETIAQLQKDTGARVKMSKSHDFYPAKLMMEGTTMMMEAKGYNRARMSDHRVGGRHHGGAGLHHGQDQREARAGQAVPRRRRHQDAAGQGQASEDTSAELDGGHDHRQGRQLHQADQGAERQLRADLAEGQGAVAAGAVHHRCRRERGQQEGVPDDPAESRGRPAVRIVPQRVVRGRGRAGGQLQPHRLALRRVHRGDRGPRAGRVGGRRGQRGLGAGERRGGRGGGGPGRAVAHAVAGAARLAAAGAAHAAHARPHQGGAAAVRVQRGRRDGDQRGAGAAGEARRAGPGAARAAAARARAALRRLLPAARAGPARRLRPHRPGRTRAKRSNVSRAAPPPRRPAPALLACVRRRRARRLARAFRGGCIRGASPPSRGAHLAVGRRGRRRRRGRRLPLRLAAAALQEPHARRRRREGLQERRDRRGHRRGYTWSRRPQPRGDPADVGREHPDIEEGHVRAGHAQPHRHHHRHAHGHLQRAVPHRAEDPGGGAQAHAPQRHLRPHAVGPARPARRPRPPRPPRRRLSVCLHSLAI